MKKKESDKPKREEKESKEETVAFPDFSTLTFAPSKYITSLSHIALRVAKSRDKAESQSEKNFLNKTVGLVYELAKRMNTDFEPRPPKTMQSAYDYALSRSYDGTFLALLDEEGHLVKTVILAKNRLAELPEYSMIDREVPMTMKARFIAIPSLNIERPIPKRAIKAVAFASDRKQIYSYK
jgi:hypothetical protein